MSEIIPNCLTVAGSDCSGGAGIQADLKTFSALGCFGTSVITSVVAENTQKVISIQNVDTKIIGDQLDAVFSDIHISAVKLGMLPTVDIIKTVSEKLSMYKPEFVVCDPVMIATSGDSLSSENTAEALKSYIFPLADIVTPNIPEAEELSGIKIRISEDNNASLLDMYNAASEICKMGAKNVLLKGGHLLNDAQDILFDGTTSHSFSSVRLETKNTHGTGCTLSSAICAFLAQGHDMTTAVELAKKYITDAIYYADKLNVGLGHGPTNHFHEFYKMKGLI